MAEARAAWQALQPEIAIDRLVFIDETGALTKTARRYGRSARGKGCVRFRPAWPLEVDDVRRRAQSATGIAAPMVLDGAKVQITID